MEEEKSKDKQIPYFVSGFLIEKSIINEIDKPSKTVKHNDFLSSASEQLSKWENFFKETDIMRMQNILNKFEITEYSCHSSVPI